MDDSKSRLHRALETAAIKAGWGIIVTAMALPTAWQWAKAIDPNGVLGTAMLLGLFGFLALSPMMLGCGLASDDLQRARRMWRSSRQPRPRNHRTG